MPIRWAAACSVSSPARRAQPHHGHSDDGMTGPMLRYVGVAVDARPAIDLDETIRRETKPEL
jgi:hypothetical protein